MAPRRREHFNGVRLGAVQHSGQVTDHATWPLSQGQLDSPIQRLHDAREPARNLKDHYLTYDGRLDGNWQACLYRPAV
jgi:hypothetical protein